MPRNKFRFEQHGLPDGGCEMELIASPHKTGRAPKDEVVIDGGRELQRCLYGFAVRSLLGESVEISASLLYLRDEVERPLDDLDTALADVAKHLQASRRSLSAGNGLCGPDAASAYDDLAFALPANAGATYCKRKAVSFAARLGDAANVWEAP